MFAWWNRTKETVAEKIRSTGFFAADSIRNGKPPTYGQGLLAKRVAEVSAHAPVNNLSAEGVVAMDSNSIAAIKGVYANAETTMSDAMLGFFLRQGFIGHHVCALLASHWLIDKACHMPASDAVRRGYAILSDDGGQLPTALVNMMRKQDERFRLNQVMVDFVGRGRVFGIRIAIFRVKCLDKSAEDRYYEAPFNPDSITPGSYQGISMVDPYWSTPVLDADAASNPDSIYFYEPTWWMINGRKYHRSHLVIFRSGIVPDLLKPAYLYGGVPIPQRIVERVYCAERTANEAPQLAMTKRMTGFATDVSKAMADPVKFAERMLEWTEFRDNFQIRMYDKTADALEQFDTTLADFDAVIMSQYVLVSGAAGVPVTKLLGTSAKGLNATGEGDETNYHEELETIQSRDLSPLVERHHLFVMRSEIAPQLPDKRPVATSVRWEPLDTPTAKEIAETQKAEGERDDIYAATGAIDAIDIRTRLSKDPTGPYFGIVVPERGDLGTDPETVNAPGVVTDSADGVKLISNQRYIDPAIVAQKVADRDFEVQVTPVFTGTDGQRYRIVIDGHHSLTAAKVSGVAPVFVEGDFTSGDYGTLYDA